MGKCKHHQICGLEDQSELDDHLCVLHCPDPNKSKTSFRQAFEKHRQIKERANKFDHIVFPCEVDLSGTTFDEGASFLGAMFLEGASFYQAKFFRYVRFTLCTFAAYANFSGASFDGHAWFTKTAFESDADFTFADFSGRADFGGAKFKGAADLSGATFARARFRNTEFHADADFSSATFTSFTIFRDLTFPKRALFQYGRFNSHFLFNSVVFSDHADFSGAIFANEGSFSDVDFEQFANFGSARFLRPVEFSGTSGKQVFLGEANFGKVVIMNESLVFIKADLSRCRMLGSDVRRARFIGVRWSLMGSRYCVYDEVVPLNKGERRDWEQLEELYRQLKQNYEERRDYERAGHFHVGEKEMRLRNPDTRLDLRFLLAFYKVISGYGENYFRPLAWLFVLILLTAATGLVHGLAIISDTGAIHLSTGSLIHWTWAILYAVQTIFHVPASEFAPKGFAKVIYTFSSILGPLLLALFGLALRQKLKR